MQGSFDNAAVGRGSMENSGVVKSVQLGTPVGCPGNSARPCRAVVNWMTSVDPGGLRTWVSVDPDLGISRSQGLGMPAPGGHTQI